MWSSAPKTARLFLMPPFVSKWLKTQAPALASFAWQRGYGAFSVGPSDLDALRHYIDTQEEHHRTRTFQEEYRAFLTKYGVEYDERYVWD
jgi:REP element-mobilizing transposase RayT